MIRHKREMVLKNIVLIRHGQSTFNAHYEQTGVDPGHRDARLTDLGKAQAAKTRDVLADQHFDLVVTSPLTRALQTSQIIFADRKLPFYVNCGHREWLEGIAEVGRPPSELAQDFPDLDFSHLRDPWWHNDPTSKAAFTAEPHGQFINRVGAFKHWLRAHPASRIAVVGHGTFFSVLTGKWLQNCEFMDWAGDEAVTGQT
eukprot:gene14608-14732_t